MVSRMVILLVYEKDCEMVPQKVLDLVEQKDCEMVPQKVLDWVEQKASSKHWQLRRGIRFRCEEVS